MSQTWIALLRGINLGAHNRVAMADLRTLLEEHGFTDVRTHLQSGNAVFTASDRPDPTELAVAVLDRTGATAPVVVIGAADLDRVIAENPLEVPDPAKFLVSFLADPSAAAPLSERDWAPEALAVGSLAAYLWCADGVQGSKLAAAMSRAAPDATARNWKTVLALQELAGKPLA